MKIDKAIERLQVSLDYNAILITRGDKEALKLGIEALKELQLRRKRLPLMEHSLLPGEAF